MGFSNNFDQYDEAIATDLEAVKVIGAALEGTNKPFVNTSGTLGVAGLGRPATEADLTPEGTPRGASEDFVIALAAKGVRSSVVRLSPCVHDAERHGLASGLAQIAALQRMSAYIGEGTNRWPAVHRRDAAHLFCLALESAPAGTRLHAVAEEGIALKAIAETIGQNLKVPVQSLSLEAAQAHFGFFSQPASIDNPSSAAETRKLLGWNPSHPTLLQDLDSFYRIQRDTEEVSPHDHD